MKRVFLTFLLSFVKFGEDAFVFIRGEELGKPYGGCRMLHVVQKWSTRRRPGMLCSLYRFALSEQSTIITYHWGLFLSPIIITYSLLLEQTIFKATANKGRLRTNC